MSEFQDVTLRILEETGALIKGDHFVYASGRHGEMYVGKDKVYPHTQKIAFLCDKIAWHFYRKKLDIEVVVGPALGGIILSQWVANTMTKIVHWDVLAVYAEKVGDGFELTRGYDELVKDKNILVTEDIITTGGSVKKVIQTVRAAGGKVVGVSSLCNRGGVYAMQLGVPYLFNMSELTLKTYEAEDCPFCKPGDTHRPINTMFGKGKQFLDEQPAKI